jgi:hypothetical protein
MGHFDPLKYIFFNLTLKIKSIKIKKNIKITGVAGTSPYHPSLPRGGSGHPQTDFFFFFFFFFFIATIEGS